MENISVIGMFKTMIPITRFNKGEASKIFEEVQKGGTKVVMKNNTPACILISPEQYKSLIEMLSDYLLLTEAENRMAANNSEENSTHEEVLKEFGISREELDAVNVEIE